MSQFLVTWDEKWGLLTATETLGNGVNENVLAKLRTQQ
jgi:hypothetical protein